MIKKINFLFLIAVSILLCQSALCDNDSDKTLSVPLIPVDGKWYMIKNNAIYYEVTLQKNDTTGYYDVKPFTCTLKTDYPGAAGVKYHSYPTGYNGTWLDGYINQTAPVKLAVTGNTNTLPFDPPYYEIYNGGCSTYLDGDVCAKQLNGRPNIYVMCAFDTQPT